MYTRRKDELRMSADEVFHGQLFSRLSALLLYILAPEAAPIIHWFRGRCFQTLEASWRKETIKSRFYA